MIKMSTKQRIILGHYKEGKSQRKLAEELGINRRTVKRYLENHRQVHGGEVPDSGIVEVPRYDSSKRQKIKLTEEVVGLIDEQLRLNAEKRRTGRSKLILRSTDIHAILREQGYEISYQTVVNYVRIKKQQGREVFIRQKYLAGESIEFDWGEVRLDLNGKDSRLMLAVFTCAYSNYRWALLYFRQDMCSFLHAHSAFFENTGGVSTEVVYDNMRTAVAKYTVRNADKVPTNDLLRLSVYYGFNYRFCNARSGNEKGHVERSVEIVRRKVFGRKSKFKSLAAANEYLTKVNHQNNASTTVKGKSKTILSRFEEEQSVMIPAPKVPFDSGIPKRLKVSKYSCIQVDNNYYSVPDNLVGNYLDVKIYPHKIKIYFNENQCFTHERRITQFEYYLKIEHYLSTLQRKPGALNRSVALRQSDEILKSIFEKHFKNRPKIFIELLLVLNLSSQPEKEKYAPSELSIAIQKCLKLCPHESPQFDKIKYFLNQKIITLPKEASWPVPSTTSKKKTDSITERSRRQLEDIQALLKSS